MPSLSDLIIPLTQSSLTTTQLNLLALAGFPVTSWQTGSVPLSLIQADTQTLASLSQTIANVAAGGLLATSPSLAPTGGTSPWTDLIAQSHYNLLRKQPVATQGLFLLSDPNSAGPFTISAFQLFAQSVNGLQFQNSASGTLPKGGTLSLVFQATTPGSAYNLANNTALTLLTPLPGVTVSNPDPGNGTGTWITVQGADAESEPSLVSRCQARWPGLGGGANIPVYQAWALAASPTVTRAQVLENTPSGGQVTIYCAGTSGASPSADVTTVNAYIQPLRPLCVTVNVLAATNNPFTVSGTVNVKAASKTSAQATWATNLAAYSAGLPIGATVYNSKIVDLIQSIPGVQNINGLTPSNTTQSQNQVAVFTDNLTWVSV